jgi:hypothetical protein
VRSDEISFAENRYQYVVCISERHSITSAE